ncbi:MAG TPA: HD domain-containing protein [Sphingobacteriaceae bacterium]|nr:HD domain-containing protein [Sphingobacteriaceae bacterium]
MVIRDPVHGDIYLLPGEEEILDSPPVQRLRGIKQNGTGYLVYPGCVHTRFDHSLGVLAAAQKLLDQVARHGHPVTPREARIVRASALVHDISHIPFGHTLEDEAGLFDRHDRRERLDVFLQDGPLAQVLARQGLAEPVTALLTGREHPEVAPWMRAIITSTVDADMLDYLKRDSYFAGLRQQYDERVYHYFHVVDGRLALNLTRHGLLRADARSEIMSLLRMRYFLTERVYLHHAKVAAGAMVARAVERAVLDGWREEDLYHLTDETLLLRLAVGSQPMAAALAQGVRRRRLLKRAYVLSPQGAGRGLRDHLVEQYSGRAGAPRRRQLEEELAAAAGLPPGSVIIHCPQKSMFKEVGVLVILPSGLQPLTGMQEPMASEVRALIHQYEDLWRFYVFAPTEAVEQVAGLCREYFGLPSDYRPR